MTDSMKYVLDASLRHVMRHDHQETRHMLHMKEWNMRCCVTAKIFFFFKTSTMDKWTKFVPQRQRVYAHHPVLALLWCLMGNRWKASHASRRLILTSSGYKAFIEI